MHIFYRCIYSRPACNRFSWDVDQPRKISTTLLNRKLVRRKIEGQCSIHSSAGLVYCLLRLLYRRKKRKSDNWRVQITFYWNVIFNFTEMLRSWKRTTEFLFFNLRIKITEMTPELGWGSKFGTTKCRTANISKIRNFEYWNNERSVIVFFNFRFFLNFFICLN